MKTSMGPEDTRDQLLFKQQIYKMQQGKIKEDLIEQMNSKFEREKAQELAEKDRDLKQAVLIT